MNDLYPLPFKTKTKLKKLQQILLNMPIYYFIVDYSCLGSNLKKKTKKSSGIASDIMSGMANGWIR